jgi:predicted alpha/beta superfamily hydrolase
MKTISLFILLVVGTAAIAQTDTVYSSYTRDHYVVTIRKPQDFSPNKKYHFVYMTDASIGIGDYVLGKSESWKAEIPNNCVVIAIAHTGDWHDKRSRDFIPSDISKNAEDDFGKADLFYLFMQKELIPMIEKKIPNKKDRVFIGHSFSGLFCLYTLFKEDKLFDQHFAISPSCWANYYELDKIEKAYFETHKKLKAKATIYVGTLEFLNKVLPSSRSFYKTVSERKYSGLEIAKDEIGYANHFSIRKPAVDKIFTSLKD